MTELKDGDIPQVVIRLWEDGDEVIMDVTFPDDMDVDNPKQFELAAMHMLGAIQEVGEDFRRVDSN